MKFQIISLDNSFNVEKNLFPYYLYYTNRVSLFIIISTSAIFHEIKPIEIRAVTSYARDVNATLRWLFLECLRSWLVRSFNDRLAHIVGCLQHDFSSCTGTSRGRASGAKTSVHRTMHPRPCPSFQALTLLAAIQRHFLAAFQRFSNILALIFLIFLSY